MKSRRLIVFQITQSRLVGIQQDGTTKHIWKKTLHTKEIQTSPAQADKFSPFGMLQITEALKEKWLTSYF